MADDAIRLALPAEPDYGRVARTAVASLALRLGFAYSEIEDLRLAIDELLILLLHPDDHQGRITLRFEPTDEGLVIDAEGPTLDEHAIDASAQGRFERLVTPIVDALSVDDENHQVHLVKNRGTAT